MSEHEIKCPIWDTSAKMIPILGRFHPIIDSPRAGGRYDIEEWALVSMKLNSQQLDDATKAHLTSWLIEQRDQGVEYPLITLDTIEYAKQRRDLPIYKRLDRFLRYLSHMESYPGCIFSWREIDPQRAQAWSESKIIESLSSPEWLGAQTIGTRKIAALEEIKFFLTSLRERGWINFAGSNIHAPDAEFNLTVSGHAHLEELERVVTDSSQAFVAMWFDSSMENVWKAGIEPGIRDAGYQPFRIDRKELSNKIDDEIIAEIRRSRFVVCDVTCELIKHNGEQTAIHRGSVYYEAGFAHGLGIHVIFTCRKDVLEKIAFDTRQYPHIVWETPETLRRDLANRIAAVIGDGPLPKPQQ